MYIPSDYPDLYKALSSIGLEIGTSFGSPMLPDFIRKRVRELMQKQEDAVERIKTEIDWRTRREYIRDSLLCSLGLTSSPESTPLSSTELGYIQRDGYIIKKVVLEPSSNIVIPAHLYIPESTSRSPAPAILCAVGHWIENGKMEPDQQRVCAGLAKLGFVVLIYDPLEQGERRPDWRCHNHLEARLVGVSQAGLSVWESMRAIDYLRSLPEVDPYKIGMTGASGGGLNTLYVSAINEHVRASVIVCYVNAFDNLLTAMRGYNWVGGQDLCNQVARVLSYADMGDICAVIAPRPLRIINATDDPMFPTEGAKRAVARARKIYDLLKVKNYVDLTLINSGHGYFQEMREAAYGWFCQWLKDEGDGSPIPEPDLEIFQPRYQCDYISSTADPNQPRPAINATASPELYCFPADHPVSSWRATTHGIQVRADALSTLRDAELSLNNWTAVCKRLKSSIDGILLPVPERKPLAPHIINRIRWRDIYIECISFESEPGITIPSMLYVNENWQEFAPVILYITDHGKHRGLIDGDIEALLRLGFAVFTPDLRGTGASSSTEFENATDSFMLDRELFVQRLWDVIRCIDYLAAYSVIGVQLDKHRIACVGRGISGLLSLYAGALDERLAAVGCLDAPVSYREMIAEKALYPASAYLFNILSHLEIEQVASVIAPRPLYIANPLNADLNPTEGTQVVASYSWLSRVYRLLNAQDQLILNPNAPKLSLEIMGRWFLDELKVS